MEKRHETLCRWAVCLLQMSIQYSKGISSLEKQRSGLKIRCTSRPLAPLRASNLSEKNIPAPYTLELCLSLSLSLWSRSTHKTARFPAARRMIGRDEQPEVCLRGPKRGKKGEVIRGPGRFYSTGFMDARRELYLHIKLFKSGLHGIRRGEAQILRQPSPFRQPLAPFITALETREPSECQH